MSEYTENGNHIPTMMRLKAHIMNRLLDRIGAGERECDDLDWVIAQIDEELKEK